MVAVVVVEVEVAVVLLLLMAKLCSTVRSCFTASCSDNCRRKKRKKKSDGKSRKVKTENGDNLICLNMSTFDFLGLCNAGNRWNCQENSSEK